MEDRPHYSILLRPKLEKKMSLFDKENQRKIEDKDLQNRIYTQLAKEGKFDQLPDTCEFSEAVALEVSDCNEVFKTLDVVGKFKGKFISVFINSEYAFWNFAQLPTKKIDFSEFKSGDIVEVEYAGVKYIGYLDSMSDRTLFLSSCSDITATEGYSIKLIKSITKIK